jgi:hypothetical protein
VFFGFFGLFTSSRSYSSIGRKNVSVIHVDFRVTDVIFLVSLALSSSPSSLRTKAQKQKTEAQNHYSTPTNPSPKPSQNHCSTPTNPSPKPSQTLPKYNLTTKVSRLTMGFGDFAAPTQVMARVRD